MSSGSEGTGARVDALARVPLFGTDACQTGLPVRTEARLVVGIVDAHAVGVVQEVLPRGSLGPLAAVPSERHQVDTLVVGQLGEEFHEPQVGGRLEVAVPMLRRQYLQAAAVGEYGIDYGVHGVAEDTVRGDRLADGVLADDEGGRSGVDAPSGLGLENVPDIGAGVTRRPRAATSCRR